MGRRPPRSTLFPYTTLSRSQTYARDRPSADTRRASTTSSASAGSRSPSSPRSPSGRSNTPRSEEHTSELQSRQYLVCRLLLEKKHHSPRHLYVPLLLLQSRP